MAKEKKTTFLLTWPICNVLYIYINEFLVGENAQPRQNIPRRMRKEKVFDPARLLMLLLRIETTSGAFQSEREREPPLLATFVVVYIFDLETVDI